MTMISTLPTPFSPVFELVKPQLTARDSTARYVSWLFKDMIQELCDARGITSASVETPDSQVEERSREAARQARAEA